MREWTEITVDEDLLSSVVRELLDMAMDPNHVEVVYGQAGRVILAEVHLAEHWYQERLKRQEDDGTEVHAGGFEVVASEDVEPANVAQSSIEPARVQRTEDLAPLPVKRGPGRPRNTPLVPSASPDGEEP
jgi:hypothetical protein